MASMSAMMMLESILVQRTNQILTCGIFVRGTCTVSGSCNQLHAAMYICVNADMARGQGSSGFLILRLVFILYLWGMCFIYVPIFWSQFIVSA